MFPEIPCNYLGTWPSEDAYRSCVNGAVEELVGKGVLSRTDSVRFQDSALRAFAEQDGKFLRLSK